MIRIASKHRCNQEFFVRGKFFVDYAGNIQLWSINRTLMNGMTYSENPAPKYFNLVKNIIFSSSSL